MRNKCIFEYKRLLHNLTIMTALWQKEEFIRWKNEEKQRNEESDQISPSNTTTRFPDAAWQLDIQGGPRSSSRIKAPTSRPRIT